MPSTPLASPVADLGHARTVDREFTVRGARLDGTERGGVREGDRIVAMNGTALEALDTGGRIAALRGSPLVLEVDRGGNRVKLHLALE